MENKSFVLECRKLTTLANHKEKTLLASHNHQQGHSVCEKRGKTFTNKSELIGFKSDSIGNCRLFSNSITQRNKTKPMPMPMRISFVEGKAVGWSVGWSVGLFLSFFVQPVEPES